MCRCCLYSKPSCEIIIACARWANKAKNFVAIYGFQSYSLRVMPYITLVTRYPMTIRTLHALTANLTTHFHLSYESHSGCVKLDKLGPTSLNCARNLKLVCFCSTSWSHSEILAGLPRIKISKKLKKSRRNSDLSSPVNGFSSCSHSGWVQPGLKKLVLECSSYGVKMMGSIDGSPVSKILRERGRKDVSCITY